MDRLKRLIRLGLAVLAAAQLAACSKTVQWEEEVPLNTGETIWVKREVTYKYKGAGGNPLDMAYRPDWTETLEFDWQGKKYSYTGEADLMLLAISPLTKRPVLVAYAGMKDWHYKHNYRCTTPFYVQFTPDERGREWSWPPKIESWLYDTPYNLMLHRAEIKNMLKRYTTKDRSEADHVTKQQSPSLVRIDPGAKSDSCLK
jgi:hypothetical protein